MKLPRVKDCQSLAEFMEEIQAIARLNHVTGIFMALEINEGEHVTTHQYNIQDMAVVAQLAREYSTLDSASDIGESNQG